MARTPRDVTDTELSVLQVLWEHGACTRRQLADALYPDGGAAGVTTVQKLLERLEEKGHVRRGGSEGPITFVAVTDREQLIGRRLREMADKLCGGSLTPLLMNLVRAKPLTPRERQELQTLLEELNVQRRNRNKPR
jgi:BlaI family penicillinase repressor